MRKEAIFGIFSKIPVLETERLILREMKVKDAPDMYEYAHLPEVTKYLLWYEHKDMEFTRKYLASVREQYGHGNFYDWAIIEKESRKMLGTCGFTSFNFVNNTAEIGYVLNPKYWRHGYASEAVGRVIEFGFERLHAHRIEGKFMAENIASRRVMEKCGMTFEGILRGSHFIKNNYEDVGICSILSGEFYSGRKSISANED